MAQYGNSKNVDYKKGVHILYFNRKTLIYTINIVEFASPRGILYVYRQIHLHVRIHFVRYS